MRILIIAEAGVNHNGSPETARRLADAAKAAGAKAYGNPCRVVEA